MILLENKPVYVSIYAKQLNQNIESVLRIIGIAINKLEDDFNEYNKKFDIFLKCVKERTLEPYIKEYSSRNENVEIDNIELNEISKYIADPNS